MSKIDDQTFQLLMSRLDHIDSDIKTSNENLSVNIAALDKKVSNVLKFKQRIIGVVAGVSFVVSAGVSKMVAIPPVSKEIKAFIKEKKDD